MQNARTITMMGAPKGSYINEEELMAIINAAIADKADKTDLDALAKKVETVVPSRVRNDSDTSRIDGAGNLYEAKFIKGGYYIVTTGGVSSQLNYSGPGSWSGSYVYEREDKKVSLIYFSTDGSVTFSGTKLGPFDIVGANPENGDVLPDFSYGNSVLQFHKQVSEFPSEPSDRFALATSLDELAKKVDAANAALEDIA